MKDPYYIYVYLNPFKPGKYTYEKHVFNFKPFYVGLGKNKRDISHIKESLDFFKYKKYRRNRANIYKISTIRSIIKRGKDPIIIRIKENISGENAISMEINIINHWGRKCNNSGFLTNMTPGGESPNHLMTSERKKKMSKWWKLINPEGKEFIVQGLNEICSKYDLNASKLATVASGKNYRHKGWNCYHIEGGNVIIKDKILIKKEKRYGKEFKNKMSKALKGKKFSEKHKRSLRKPKGPLTKTDAFMKGKKRGALKRKGIKNLKITRNWEFISPERKIYNIRGTKDFCEKFNLIPACISAAVTKKRTYKKWRIRELPADFFENNQISSF